jgi:hypothetical protein
MRYFFVRENSVVSVRSFVFSQGQTPIIRTPTLGGDVFRRGRPELSDEFFLGGIPLERPRQGSRVVDQMANAHQRCPISTSATGRSVSVPFEGRLLQAPLGPLPLAA